MAVKFGEVRVDLQLSGGTEGGERGLPLASIHLGHGLIANAQVLPFPIYKSTRASGGVGPGVVGIGDFIGSVTRVKSI